MGVHLFPDTVSRNFMTYNRKSDGDHMRRYYADKHRNFPPHIDRISGREYVSGV
jgi:hypothetical protein